MKNSYNNPLVKNIFILLLSATSLFSHVQAQCPVADFDVPDTVCINENVYIDNQDVVGNSYLWDFCDSELSSEFTINNLSTDEIFKNSFNITLAKDDTIWYGFLVDFVSSKLLKLDFGQVLRNNPNIENLNNLNDKLDQPQSIELFNENGHWFGLICQLGPSKLLRLSFGTSLENIPSVEQINMNLIQEPTDHKIVRTSSGIYAFIANGNNGEGSVVVLNFGTSIANEPLQRKFSIPGSDRVRGISMLQIACDKFVGFVSSYDNGQIFTLDFKAGLSADPMVSQLPLMGETIKDPARNYLAHQSDSIYGFVQSRRGELFRLIMDKNLNVAKITDLGRVDANSVNAFGFTMAKEGTNWTGFSVDFSKGKLNQVIFDENCNFLNASYLSQRNPPPVQYLEAGEYTISAKIENDYGLETNVLKYVYVKESVVPAIDFNLDGLCVSSIVSFNPVFSTPITSANWSINSETRTGQSATYDFLTPGTYSVTLEVESANGCGNRLTKEITIYEPPVPSFTVPMGQVCSNGAVNFTNTTDARGADDLITYRWFVIDPGKNETLVSEEANPAITFAAGGTHTVRLEAGIPGCTETFVQTIDILQGPTVSFTVPTVCQSNAVTFENQTIGADITGYFWDFGDPDGGTYSSVTADNPTYTFNTPGTYPVSLRVTNALGCQNVYRQDVTVYAQPTVSFLSEVACAGSPTQFTDASTAGANANVSAWQWDFADPDGGDGIGTASTRNPTYAYRQAGTYAVKLITTSTAGCVDSTVQTVTVKSAVDVGFAAVRQCPTEARPLNVLLSDTSVAAEGETIDRWFWTVNGENFVSAEVEYAFPAPGDYPVSLTAFTTSGCNATVQRIVSVTTSPAAAFSSVGSCTGEPVAFQGEIDAPGWEALSYAWEFVGPNGEEAGTAATANPEVVFEASGTYAVTLTVQTDGGCSFSTTRSVTIAATPVATFTASADYGGTPLEVSFANATTDATAYAWDFGGIGTSEAAEPTFTFAEVGTYVVTLTATNAAGCASTTQQTVEVVLPVQDLRLDDFTVADSPTGVGQQLVLTLSNRGTRVASGVVVTVDLDETLTVEERRAEPLLPGQTVVYVTKFRLPTQQRNQQRPLRYLCARIAATDADFAEAQLDNNRNCLSLNEQLNVEPPFPNPASEQLHVSVILPEVEAVMLRLLNQDGRVVRTHRQEATLVGLNTFLLDVQGLPVGAYLLQISYRDAQRQFRVAVGR